MRPLLLSSSQAWVASSAWSWGAWQVSAGVVPGTLITVQCLPWLVVRYTTVPRPFAVAAHATVRDGKVIDGRVGPQVPGLAAPAGSVETSDHRAPPSVLRYSRSSCGLPATTGSSSLLSRSAGSPNQEPAGVWIAARCQVRPW